MKPKTNHSISKLQARVHELELLLEYDEARKLRGWLTEAQDKLARSESLLSSVRREEKSWVDCCSKLMEENQRLKDQLILPVPVPDPPAKPLRWYQRLFK